MEAQMDAIRKVFTTTVKALEGRVLEFIGTTEGVDRDGEIIKSEAWQLEKYLANPVVQWAHDYSQPPIGKTISIRRDGTNTIFGIEFADYEFADTIFKLCKGGFLNATSVGFIPIEYVPGQKGTGKTYTKVELLELSIVPVPSNPEALITAREAGVITVKEFESITTHKKEPKKTTQALIKDEIDYLIKLIDEAGVCEETKASSGAMLIKRLQGNDMPVNDTTTPMSEFIQFAVNEFRKHMEARNG
jgi:HK97 family phage prohead protease